MSNKEHVEKFRRSRAQRLGVPGDERALQWFQWLVLGPIIGHPLIFFWLTHPWVIWNSCMAFILGLVLGSWPKKQPAALPEGREDEA